MNNEIEMILFSIVVVELICLKIIVMYWKKRKLKLQGKKHGIE